MQCQQEPDFPELLNEPEMMDISVTSSLAGMESLLDTTLPGFSRSELDKLEVSYKGDPVKQVD